MARQIIKYWKQVAAFVLMIVLSSVIGSANCEAVSQRESKPLKESRSLKITPGKLPSVLNGSGSVKPAQPALYLDTAPSSPPRSTIPVKRRASGAQDLQAALDSAMPGDVIQLDAGATFTGNFTLPNKTSSLPGWIIIRSSSADSQLPPKGVRVTPDVANAFPKIVSPNSDPAITAAPGAHNYRFIGIEFTITPDVSINYGIVSLGPPSINSADLLPTELIIDRCYIHGSPDADVMRGIAMNCGIASVFDSYISECHARGFDSQAIACWNGSGPFNITNNYLEAAGENVLFGGADPTIPNLVPADITFRNNTCSKPLTWKTDNPSYAGKHWTVKNCFELKNARRVLVEGNIFENCWHDAQVGIAILFTPRNQGGTAPWSTVEDVTFVNNIVWHVAGGINILGTDDEKPSQQSKTIAIVNNLFSDVNGALWGGDGNFLNINGVVDVIVDHNTVLQSGTVIVADVKPNSGFVFTNNIMPHNRYGVFGSGVGTGTPALQKYFPECIFKKNVLIGGQQSDYPKSNLFPAQISDIGFVNYGNGIFELSPNSGFKGRGTDGKDIGCDMNELWTALNSRQNSNTGSGGVCTGQTAPAPANLPADTVWVDDQVPAGALFVGIWSWGISQKVSGALSNTEPAQAGIHQHFFQNAAQVLAVGPSDKLVCYVLLSPCATPQEVMLQWHDAGGWEHRAYWGANVIPWGSDGTASRQYMGALPASGQWVRLEVPASQVGLNGHAVDGMAFSLYGGQAWFDRAGKDNASGK